MTAPAAPLLRYNTRLVWLAALIGIPAWIAHLTFPQQP